MEKNNLKAEWMEFVRNRWIAGALADAQDNNDDAGTGDGVPVVTSEYLQFARDLSELRRTSAEPQETMKRPLLLLLSRPIHPRILAGIWIAVAQKTSRIIASRLKKQEVSGREKVHGQ